MPRIDLLKIYASRFPLGRDRLRKTPLHRLKPAETSFKDRTSTSKPTETQTRTEAPPALPDAPDRGRPPPLRAGAAGLSEPGAPCLFPSVTRRRGVLRGVSRNPGISTTAWADGASARGGPSPGTTRGHERAATRDPRRQAPAGVPRTAEQAQPPVCATGAPGAVAAPWPGGPSHITCSPARGAVAQDSGAAPAECPPPTEPARQLLPAPCLPVARAPAQHRAHSPALAWLARRPTSVDRHRPGRPLPGQPVQPPRRTR